MFLPKTLDEIKLRIFLLVRGCIAIFTLRGSDSKLYFLLSFGSAPGAGTILHKLLVGSWALVLAATAVLFLARSRVPAVRFLVAWFAVHMLIVSAATGLVSRMFYLGAIPAALLSSWLLWRGAEIAAGALGRRLAIPSPEGVTVEPARRSGGVGLAPLRAVEGLPRLAERSVRRSQPRSDAPASGVRVDVIGDIDKEEVGTFLIRLLHEQDTKISVHTDREEAGPILEGLEVQPRTGGSSMELLQRFEGSGSERFSQLRKALTEPRGGFGADRAGHLDGVLR
ncbi:MAG TPA: hypothetical protein VGS07_01105 [Thermoanaerobaculia bacterium]|jgi:hypothetical protein|nr:hypothetical protein [Thermoanaerobaculia bacterium]